MQNVLRVQELATEYNVKTTWHSMYSSRYEGLLNWLTQYTIANTCSDLRNATCSIGLVTDTAKACLKCRVECQDSKCSMYVSGMSGVK